MAELRELVIGTNDYGEPWGFTIYTDETMATPKDITDYTVTLKVWAAGSPGTLVINAACTKDTPASGTCHYTPVVGNKIATKSAYYAELELTKTGVVDSSWPFMLVVKESG